MVNEMDKLSAKYVSEDPPALVPVVPSQLATFYILQLQFNGYVDKILQAKHKTSKSPLVGTFSFEFALIVLLRFYNEKLRRSRYGIPR